jgi:hypothetical protein
MNINIFGLVAEKIFELASSIILAIKILKIINDDDSKSILEN